MINTLYYQKSVMKSDIDKSVNAIEKEKKNQIARVTKVRLRVRCQCVALFCDDAIKPSQITLLQSHYVRPARRYGLKYCQIVRLMSWLKKYTKDCKRKNGKNP